jgi:IS30 family transposase
LAQKIGLDAIWCEYGNTLGISKRTFYRWADLGYGVINMELPKKVGYKPRKKNKANETLRPDLEGRRYADFKELPEEVRMSAFEMDCVEGLRKDKKVILTLFHKRTHFQFGILLAEHTSECVVGALDALETVLGNKFRKLIPLIVVDRGHEFRDIEAMEKSALGKGKRSKVYVCDPQRPDQRGQSERAHVDVRKILPKKVTSFDVLTPWDIATVFSHVNSVPRPSLGGVAPMALAMAMFPSEFFEELGLTLVSTTMIYLKPDLLDRKENNTN